jgi:hypothetical protein
MKGMGVDSCTLYNRQEYEAHYKPGHMWMTLLNGEHVSTDCAVIDGEARWWRHTTGVPMGAGTFDYWIIHAASRPRLENYLGNWLGTHMRGYTGLMNFETIGGNIIEAHLRFADQWPDLYGEGWVESAVGLYSEGVWRFADRDRGDGYSVVLFGRHGYRFRHPPASMQSAVLALPSVKSLQNTYHESRDPEDHAMPPGGFRLAIVNCTALESGFEARRMLADAYSRACLLLPETEGATAMTVGMSG